MTTKLLWILVLAGVLIGIGASILPFINQKPNQTELTCLASLAQSNPMNIDAKGYCSCVGQAVGKNTVTDLESETVRKSVQEKGAVCVEEYMKPGMEKMCADINVGFEQAKGQERMDCGCFFTELKDRFVKLWIVSDVLLTEAEKQRQMSEGAKLCLKQTAQ